MQHILSKLSNLSGNTIFKDPTDSDSGRVETTLFDEDISSSSSGSVPGTCSPPATDVVKYSSAFNSERASGMSKLEQLQFVKLLKKAILGKDTISNDWGGELLK
jgi:hypothetical protein